jgi:hypothetical protein
MTDETSTSYLAPDLDVIFQNQRFCDARQTMLYSRRRLEHVVARPRTQKSHQIFAAKCRRRQTEQSHRCFETKPLTVYYFWEQAFRLQPASQTAPGHFFNSKFHKNN